jgi:hypothetical protein
VQNLPIFTWVPELVDGYNKKDCLNIDEGRSVDVMRRLTVIQHERARNEAQQLGFTSGEHDNMQEFYNREIKRNDAKRVIQTVEFMFKDIQNPKLRRYFIDALTTHVKIIYKRLIINRKLSISRP